MSSAAEIGFIRIFISIVTVGMLTFMPVVLNVR